MNTRLVRAKPGATRPPVWYTPLETRTVSLAAAASTAAWMVCFAVAQFVPAAASLPFVLTNHVAASVRGLTTQANRTRPHAHTTPRACVPMFPPG